MEKKSFNLTGPDSVLEQDYRATLLRALEVYGKEPQLNQLQEECAELIAAVNHYRRGRITVDDLASETADVLIMLDQIKILLDHETNRDFFHLVERATVRKMAILKSRLDGAPLK